MDLEPNSDEQQLIDSAQAFLKKEAPATRLHHEDAGRFTDSMRGKFGELGWYALGLSEEMGGFGFTVVDEMLLYREMGRQLAPVGMLPIGLAVKIAAAANEPALVEQLIAGAHGVALAINDPNHEHARIFEWDGADFACTVGPEGAQLLQLSRSAVEPAPSFDKSVSMGFADLTTAPVIARTDSAQIDYIGRLLTAASLVGAAEAMTDMIVEYAKIRETFSRPIGAYQAVRHPCADMAVRAFAARAQLFFAAICMRDGRVDSALQVDAAKALANETALLNADSNIQLHGGIATTDEHDAHLFLKRAHLMAQLFGGRTVLERILKMPAAV